jgi:hypothetical protein
LRHRHLASDRSREYKEDPDAIFLIDGVPTTAPDIESHRFVVFLSPNEHWFRKMEKEGTHLELYMPFWDAEELMDAVDKLDIKDEVAPLDVESSPRDDARHVQEVVYRSNIAGGTARVCLECDDVAYKEELDGLKYAAATVDLATGMAMVQGEKPRVVRHRLYHFIPDDEVFLSSLKVASPYVEKLLRDRLKKLTVNGKERFKSMIASTGEAAALNGSIHENDVHDLLKTGTSLVAHQLSGNGVAPLGDLVLELPTSVSDGLSRTSSRRPICRAARTSNRRPRRSSRSTGST